MGFSVTGITKLFYAFGQLKPNAGKLIGTSKSGINVYESISQNGSKVLTSYKNGGVFKEVTKEATQVSKDGSSYFNTLIKDYFKNEYTTMTKHFNKHGKTTCIASTSRDWNGVEDVGTLGHKVLSRGASQYFEAGKLKGKSYFNGNKSTEAIYTDWRTQIFKKGTTTIPNGQIHKNYNYEKNIVNSPINNEQYTRFKPLGTAGIEVTDKGVNFLPSFLEKNFSKGPEYFRTH